MAVHDHAVVRVTAHTSGRRLAAACGGHLRSRAGPPAGLCSGGGGSRCQVSVMLLVAFVPDSPSRRRLTEADRPGGVKPHHCCCAHAPSGWTPPDRPAWLRPPTRRGIRDNPGVCKKDPRATTVGPGRPVATVTSSVALG